MPAVAQRLAAEGIIPSKMTADEFAAFAASENKKWLDVMKRAKVEPN
jgi:tripartite-type tricarboxylate transporter receptor subunit TctC